MNRVRQLFPSHAHEDHGPYVVLSLVGAFLGTYFVTLLVTASLEERFANQLAESARVVSDSVVRREREHLETVRGVAFTEGVAELVASARGAELEQLVLPLAANGRAEIVEVLDARGTRTFGLRLADPTTLEYQAIADAVDRSAWPLVRSVLSRERDELEDKFAGIVSTSAGLTLYTAGPIEREGKLVGVVLVGTPLSSFLPLIKGDAFADVTFYDEVGAPLATRFPRGFDEAVGAALGPRTGAIAPSPGLREHRSLSGREYALLHAELRVRDELIGAYSVGLATSFVTSARGTAWLELGLLFATGAVLVLMIGWLLARSLTSPLARLVNTARLVSEGDLTARSGIRSGDEIGSLAVTFDAMAESLQRQHLGTIRALVTAIDARDPYTRGHSVRVGQLAVELGSELGLPEAQLQHLEVGGCLHDIGKIGIRDAILLKPGALTEEERETIELHPQIGLEILQTVELPMPVTAVVGGHHEKLDGSGYPLGLTSDELTVFPRIAAVADIYDALTTGRPYREAMTIGEALAILEREAGAGLLDPEVASVMRQVAPQWEERRRGDPALEGYTLAYLTAANIVPIVPGTTCRVTPPAVWPGPGFSPPWSRPACSPASAAAIAMRARAAARIDIGTRSFLVADYSAAPAAASLSPLKLEIVESAAEDGRRLPEPSRSGATAVATATPLAGC